jgi:hypothetical protein
MRQDTTDIVAHPENPAMPCSSSATTPIAILLSVAT